MDYGHYGHGYQLIFSIYYETIRRCVEMCKTELQGIGFFSLFEGRGRWRGEGIQPR